jgi:hypothetical protein
MNPSNSHATGRTVRFSTDPPTEIGCQISDDEHVWLFYSYPATETTLTRPPQIRDSDPARSPADPTEEDTGEALDVGLPHPLAAVGVSADPTAQDEQDESRYSEETRVDPFEPDVIGGDVQDVPLRYIIRLELVPGIQQYPTESIPGNVTVTAATEASQDIEPSGEEEITVWWPVFYFAVFLFGLYLWFTLFAIYVSLRRVFFS